MGKHILATDQNFKKIVILITGVPNIGKTSTSIALQSEKTVVLHGDRLLFEMDRWCSDSKCKKIHQECLELYKDQLNHHLNQVGKRIEQTCPAVFIKKLLESDYMKTEKSVILLEGYVFGLPKVRRELFRQMRSNYILWEMNKIAKEADIPK